MSTQALQNAMSHLGGALVEMPVQMRLFSLCLRSLYAEKSVGSDRKESQKFRNLRDRTRDDALAYLKGILPVVTKCVSNIGDYFEYYIALDEDEWWESIDDIIEEATKYHEACKVLVMLHELILEPLKARADQAKVLVAEMTDLTEEFERQAEKLREEAGDNLWYARAMLFIPIVGLIVSRIYESKHRKASADSVAKKEQATINALATRALSEALVPALTYFINGLEELAKFFEIVKYELESLKEKGGDANAKKQAGEGHKALHYKFMQSKAKTMKEGCFGFYAMLPAVRTDFKVIPTEGTDENYVDRWLARQKRLIEENCKVEGVKATLLKAIIGQ
eukprot:Seg1100.2 transcript_id=Seg1100.2/GoldUCD/mRNA.D3Y31 product="hypothetical protein" protein_id=Seg1100.2/GoldUCD/D3Y31